MTATATTEIDVLDLDADCFRLRELGDLKLAEWDRAPMADVLALDQAPYAQRDLVMVAIEDDHGGCAFPERVLERTLTLPRAVLVGAGCDANIPACLVLEQDQPLVEVLLMVLDEVWSRLAAMSGWEVEATRGALVTLIAAVIRAESGSVTARSGLPALRAQIDEWVTSNLDSGPIRIEDLAVAHCVSPRTIHRAFFTDRGHHENGRAREASCRGARGARAHRQEHRGDRSPMVLLRPQPPWPGVPPPLRGFSERISGEPRLLTPHVE